MIPSEVEWRRLYLYTCRIIAAQFPVPVATVPGLFLRAYLDWLVEQAGCRLNIFQEKCPPILASTISPDLTVWMHPRRLELLVADSQCSTANYRLRRPRRRSTSSGAATWQTCLPTNWQPLLPTTLICRAIFSRTLVLASTLRRP